MLCFPGTFLHVTATMEHKTM